MVLEFSICILSSELPFNGASPSISVTLPDTHLRLQGFPICNPAVEALASKDADFNFLLIQPAGVRV